MHKSITYFSGLAFGLLLWGGLAIPAQTVTTFTSQISRAESAVSVLPEVPLDGDRGTPSRQTDLGTRQPCARFDPGETGPLTALIPGTDAQHYSSPYLTVAERPSIWVYVPMTAEDLVELEFELWQSLDAVQSVTIPVPENLPGVVEVPLPSSWSGLEVGETYSWSLAVHCAGSRSNAADLVVMSTIQRVEPSAALNWALLTATTPEAQIEAYANRGLWHDALTRAGQRYREQAEKSAIAAQWTTLLQELGIDLRPNGIEFTDEDISEHPIVN